MATQAVPLEVSPLAGADLTAKQFFLVKLSTSADDTVLLAAANTDVVYGVLTNKPNTGQAAEVQIVGVAKVVAGAAFTRGDALMSDANGNAITKTSTNPIFGYALESAGGSGEIHSVRLV